MTVFKTTFRLSDIAHLAGRGQLELLLPSGDIVLIVPDSDVYRATERAATRQTIRRSIKEAAGREQG